MKTAWMRQLGRKMSVTSSRRRRVQSRPLVEVMERRLVLYNTYVGQGDSDAVWSFTNLSYSFSNLLDSGLGGVSTSDLVSATEEAMGAWTAVTPLAFFQQNDSGPGVGDGNYDPIGHPFMRWGHHYIDGTGNATTGLDVLAHGYRPGDGGINGDMHFDDGETWNINTFLEVAAHEFGHAIGMAHANGDATTSCPPATPAIMDSCIGSYYSGLGTAFLYQDDINGIQSLYGSGLGYVLTSSGELNVYGTGGSDTMVVSASGGNVTVSSNGRSFTRRTSGISSINIHGEGGTDYLRVESNAGLTTILDGDGGDDFFDMSYYARNLSNITGHVYVKGGDGTDTVYLYDNNNGAASTYTVDSAQVNRSGFGGMSYDVPVEGVTLIAGAAVDTVNIPSTYPGTPVYINNSGGRDTVNVGGAYNGLQLIRADVQVQNDPSYTILNVNDTGDTTARNARVDKNGAFGYLTGMAPANIFWDTADIDSINIKSGNAADTINVVRNTEILALDSAGGADVVNIGNGGSLAEITGGITIRNAPSFTTLNVDGSAESGTKNVSLYNYAAAEGTFGQIVGLAPATIQYKVGDTSAVTVQTGTGVATVGVASISRATNIIGHSNSTTINVGLGGSVQGIQNTLTLTNPPAHNLVYVDDSADTVGRSVSLGTFVGSDGLYGTIVGLAPGSIYYKEADTFTAVNVLTGSGGNSINVAATTSRGVDLYGGTGNDLVTIRSTAGPTNYNGRGGSDTVTVGNAGSVQAILGEITLLNPPAYNTVTVDDSADPTGRAVTFGTIIGSDGYSYGSIVGLAPGPIYYKPYDTNYTGITVNTGNGADAINLSGTAPRQINLNTGGGSDTVTVGTLNGAVVYNGGPGANALVGPTAGATWYISGSNSGSVGLLAFSSVGSLVGGAGADTFAFANGVTFAGTIDGGSGSDTVDLSAYTSSKTVNPFAGTVSGFGVMSHIERFVGGSAVDTLVGPNANATWNIAGPNSGSVTSGGVTVGFAGFEKVNAGSGNDNFVFADGASLSGAISGGAGSNTLNFSAEASPVVVNLATGGYALFQNVIGGSATDTLIGPNSTNVWDVTNNGSGDLNGTVTFSHFENLTGGSGADTFKFSAGKHISGVADGKGGNNTLNFALYTTALTVNLAAGTSNGGGFANIDTLVGGGSTSDRLIGADGANTWTLTGANAGTVGSLGFSSFENLTGGASNDTFKFNASGKLTGSIVGGDGTVDKLDYSPRSTAVSVNFATGQATSVGGTFSGIESVSGGSSTADTLIGPNAANTWAVTADNAGKLNVIAFAGFENLTGGTARDVFKLSNSKGVTGKIDGGTGVDWLDDSSYTTAVTVSLAAGTATNVGSLANLEAVRAGSGGSTLTGKSGAHDILVGGSGSDVIHGGSGRSILIGGKGTDTVVGGSSDDVVIGDSSSYDANYIALEAILAEWISANAYGTRVAHLRSGGGLNGSYKLTYGTTVKSDGSIDHSTGSGGLDWFLASSNDVVTDLAVNELVN